SNVTAIAAGSSHSIFLKSDGSLWGMGYNGYGQLGVNGSQSTNRPEMILPYGVIAISAGGNHSLIIKSDGSLWGLGDNQLGELGDGALNNVYSPEPIQQPANYRVAQDQLLASGNVRVTFVGVGTSSYALDRTFNLKSPLWVPQQTNIAGAGGVLIFTNTPNKATNNFWRIRSVP
ncbi:MAG TPA: hypothetical protein VH251_10650, partial [Verrucomicrobiae bacterium]|nr:hypothetical protein [Verrucomicrobiae bacterium]